MSQLRKIQRNNERQEDELVPDNFQKLPEGRVLTSPIKGDFWTMPLFAWVRLQVKTRIPYVVVRMLLVRSAEDMNPRGILEVAMPFLAETERATLAVLERYGWDGRSWPRDEGWPDGDDAGGTNLRALMETASIKATLPFPPTDKGHALQPVSVTRARGPFLMPPLPEPEGEPDLWKLERLRGFCKDPTTMLLSTQTSESGS